MGDGIAIRWNTTSNCFVWSTASSSVVYNKYVCIDTSKAYDVVTTGSGSLVNEYVNGTLVAHQSSSVNLLYFDIYPQLAGISNGNLGVTYSNALLEAGVFPTGSGSGCTVYACSTFTITVTDSLCANSSLGCENVTSTTTASYDASSTALLQTDCTNTVSHDQNGCFTSLSSTTVVSTAVSSLLVTDTTTTTSLVYQINAPNPTQFTFWFFPLLFMGLGIAITLGPVAGVKRGDIGSVNEKTLVTLLLSGLVIGTILGVGAGLVNYVFPIMFITILIIYLWSSRG